MLMRRESRVRCLKNALLFLYDVTYTFVIKKMFRGSSEGILHMEILA